MFFNKRFNQVSNRALVSTELCIVAVSAFFTLAANQRFWSAWLAGQSWSDVGTWMQVAGMAMLLTAVHSLLLGLVVTRHSAKFVLGAVLIATALAVHYMNRYTVFFDADMMRNVFHTDYKEARELLSLRMLIDVLIFGVIPAIVLFRLPLRVRPLRRAAIIRLGFMLGALAVAIAAMALNFQELSAQMRNQKELRYLITPGNYIVSSLRIAAASGIDAHEPRIPIGTDARQAAAATSNGKPRVLVVVVGETARAANWGLNGYARQTTPQLAAAGVINFPHVTSCGSNTEVSLPCMFSMYGRKNYDEKEIRRHESVLHVLNRSGVKTLWRDNQSGCKGVCEGLDQQRLDSSKDAALCNGERCLDEILLKDLESELQKNPRDMVIVLHQLGNHGPAYFQRYPAAYRRFLPACETSDLGKCAREEIVNSYDNALLYTDHFLAETVRRLKAQMTHDAAMIYVSDHGESLGEKGIYLHGLPYAIAPKEQTEVPMVMWLSPAFAASAGVDTQCLKQHANRPVSHDYLFHSILGFMRVKTSVYAPSFDLAANCRGNASQPGVTTDASDQQAIARTAGAAAR
jgi:lipid A ethanolaminephosphotransferase